MNGKWNQKLSDLTVDVKFTSDIKFGGPHGD